MLPRLLNDSEDLALQEIIKKFTPDKDWSRERVSRSAQRLGKLPLHWDLVDHHLLRAPGAIFPEGSELLDDFDCTHWTLGLRNWAVREHLEERISVDFPYDSVRARVIYLEDSERGARDHMTRYASLGAYLWLLDGCLDLLAREITFTQRQLEHGKGKILSLTPADRQSLNKTDFRKLTRTLRKNPSKSRLAQRFLDCTEHPEIRDWLSQLNLYRNLFSHNAMHFFYRNRLFRLKKTYMNNQEYRAEFRVPIAKLEEEISAKRAAQNFDGALETEQHLFQKYIHEMEIPDFCLTLYERVVRLISTVFALLVLEVQ